MRLWESQIVLLVRLPYDMKNFLLTIFDDGKITIKSYCVRIIIIVIS